MGSLFGLDDISAHDKGLECIATTHTQVETGMVSGLLDDAGIPYLIKERGSGGSLRIIAGYSIYGTDIFVPAELFERAAEVLRVMEADGTEEDLLMDEEEEEDAEDEDE